MKKYGQAAMMEMIVKALPEMAAEIAKPLSTIDKVTIIDSGNGSETGVGSMGSYVPSVLAQTIESVKETTGIDIREIDAGFLQFFPDHFLTVGELIADGGEFFQFGCFVFDVGGKDLFFSVEERDLGRGGTGIDRKDFV